MNTVNIETTVREFLRDHITIGEQATSVSADESLLDSGLIDSAGLFELVGFLEDRFKLTIADEELVPENFETIASIVALVRSKETSTSGAGEPQA